MEGGGATLLDVYQSAKKLLLNTRNCMERLKHLDYSASSDLSLSLSNDISQIQSLCIAEEADSLRQSLDKYNIKNQKQITEAKERAKLLGLANGDSSHVLRIFDEEAQAIQSGTLGDSDSSKQFSDEELSNKLFWKIFANVINANIIQKLGLSVLEKLKWDGLEFLNKIGSQSQNIAENIYIQFGLALPGSTDDKDQRSDKDNTRNNDKTSDQPAIAVIQSSLPEVKKATENLIRQTYSILGGLMLLTTTISKMKNKARSLEEKEIKEDCTKVGVWSFFPQNGLLLDEKKAEEMRALFSTAESAVEAWAMMTTSLGHPSYIKSEFEKYLIIETLRLQFGVIPQEEQHDSLSFGEVSEKTNRVGSLKKKLRNSFKRKGR
ncbi:hypothetical protein HN51_059646 [Arachis hypogaea]